MMQQFKLLFLALMLFGYTGFSQASNIKKATNEINWITFEEAEQKMKEQPKKVIIDFYTNWCGWCKVMDKKTYSNSKLIDYVNENFYAIKFNAEQKEPVEFMEKKWVLAPGSKTHELAVALMNGRMSYPTTVFLEEGFKNAQPVPGYLEIHQMESVMKFIGEGINKKMEWNDFQRDFKPEWKPE